MKTRGLGTRHTQPTQPTCSRNKRRATLPMMKWGELFIIPKKSLEQTHHVESNEPRRKYCIKHKIPNSNTVTGSSTLTYILRINYNTCIHDIELFQMAQNKRGPSSNKRHTIFIIHPSVGIVKSGSGSLLPIGRPSVKWQVQEQYHVTLLISYHDI